MFHAKWWTCWPGCRLGCLDQHRWSQGSLALHFSPFAQPGCRSFAGGNWAKFAEREKAQEACPAQELYLCWCCFLSGSKRQTVLDCTGPDCFKGSSWESTKESRTLLDFIVNPTSLHYFTLETSVCRILFLQIKQFPRVNFSLSPFIASRGVPNPLSQHLPHVLGSPYPLMVETSGNG